MVCEKELFQGEPSSPWTPRVLFRFMLLASLTEHEATSSALRAEDPPFFFTHAVKQGGKKPRKYGGPEGGACSPWKAGSVQLELLTHARKGDSVPLDPFQGSNLPWKGEFFRTLIPCFMSRIKVLHEVQRGCFLFR